MNNELYLFVVIQLVIVVFLMIWFFILFDQAYAYSVGCGGIIVWFANLYSIRLMNNIVGNICLYKIIGWFYFAELSKWLLSVVLISAVFVVAKDLKLIIVLIGFMITVLLSLLISIFLYCINNKKTDM